MIPKSTNIRSREKLIHPEFSLPDFEKDPSWTTKAIIVLLTGILLSLIAISIQIDIRYQQTNKQESK